MTRTFSTIPLHLRGALEAEARRQAKRDRKRGRKATTTPAGVTTTDQAPPSVEGSIEAGDSNATRGAEPRTSGDNNG